MYRNLVVVKSGSSKELYQAPFMVIQEGDIVETDFCRGEVIKVDSISTDSDLWEMLTETGRLGKVLSLIIPVKYGDEDENALSDQ